MGFGFFRHVKIAFCAHVLMSDQRERWDLLPSGSSNWVEGTALILRVPAAVPISAGRFR